MTLIYFNFNFRKITSHHDVPLRNICKSRSEVSTSCNPYDIFRSPFVPSKDRSIITNTFSITSVDIFRWATLLNWDSLQAYDERKKQGLFVWDYNLTFTFNALYSFVWHPVYLNRFMLGEKLSAAEQKELSIRRGST